jgi:Zn-dependent alcohol dehydrogenase
MDIVDIELPDLQGGEHLVQIFYTTLGANRGAAGIVLESKGEFTPKDTVIVVNNPDTIALHAVVHSDNIIGVDRHITGIEAAVIGSDVAMGISLVANIVEPIPGLRVLIIGGNGIGLGAALMSSLYSPYEISCADTSLANIEYMEACGCGIRYLVNDTPLHRKVADMVPEKYDIVILADPTILPVRSALKCIHSTGELYVVGTGKCKDSRVTYVEDCDIDNDFISYVIDLVGDRMLPVYRSLNDNMLNLDHIKEAADIKGGVKIVRVAIG